MAQMASERELKPAEKPELSPGEYLPLRVMAFPEEASESAPTLCTEHERTAPSLMVARRDAIFVLILVATVVEHLLHKLLRTFAILGVHDLEHSVKAHWFRFREAEQSSPLLRYPKFVIPDVPKPQTEVRCAGREARARFAFPQRLLGPPAFRHAGGKRHRSNGDHSRPGLQSKKRLVFRFLGEWPETMQCAPNRDR